ncbi:MAG: replication initiator protein A [Lachnospiraceae bacterium]|nr:replication initiator protein A [Lachnospiraceae bacterium]
MKYAYFKGKESETFRFIQVPFVFFEDEKFKKLSADAKLLFGLLLSKMSLSRENNWFDEDNNVYIKWSQEKIGEKIGRSKPTVGKILKELVTAGLIEYPKHGQGDCATIYVKDFLHELNDDYNEEESEPLENTEKSKSFTSRNKEVLPQEIKDLSPNYIDTNYKKENYTTTEIVVVDDEIKILFSDLNLSDSDIKAIIHATTNDPVMLKKATDYVKNYRGRIENVVGFIISFIKAGGYQTVPQHHTPPVPTLKADDHPQQCYNMAFLTWANEHNDDDNETWMRSAELVLGYSLTDEQKNNYPEVYRLLLTEFNKQAS